MIPIEHYLLLSAIVFFIGVYGFIARKNFLAMLISIELMLNAVELNFSVFNRYLFPQHLEGMFFTLFGIAIAAAETAIAIAIIVNIYRNLQNIDVQSAELMKN
ncbi:NADH-quinone oxidoreductase subunit K [Bacteroidia bacterium]|nr:NADH-quinone oxidoreductase subunit K [Bacteroidia bacterium]